jgi:hypothetical protein
MMGSKSAWVSLIGRAVGTPVVLGVVPEVGVGFGTGLAVPVGSERGGVAGELQAAVPAVSAPERPTMPASAASHPNSRRDMPPM